MFAVNDDLSIYVTRGDVVFLSVTADNCGELYKFQPDDVVRLKVFGKKNCEDVVLQKDFFVTSETEQVEIYLTKQETKIGESINKPKDYWYEIELNPTNNPHTIIGYDDDGAKIFRLFPEGSDIEDTDNKVPIYSNARYILRSDPLEKWNATNPILLDGELARINDGTYPQIFKLGDGVTPWRDLPYLSIEGVGQGTIPGGEIFNDYENNLAGIRGYKIIAWDSDKSAYTLSSAEGLDTVAVGTQYSIIWGSNYINAGTITAVNGATVTVTTDYNINNESKNSLIVNDPNTEEKVFFIVSRPELGDIAINEHQHAEGTNTQALLRTAHSEGRDTRAVGKYSHAEGRNTEAHHCAHAEGLDTIARGHYSHAEGSTTRTYGRYSHAEGERTEAHGETSHSEGRGTKALKTGTHSEGINTIASGEAAHAEGRGILANENNGVEEYTEASGMGAHAEGRGSKASETAAHAEGNKTKAIGYASHAEGNESKASGNHAHSEGSGTTSSGQNAHAEGFSSHASGNSSHSEGNSTFAQGSASHAEGTHAESLGEGSHAEGYYTHATNEGAHAEGRETFARGKASHAEGVGSITEKDAYAAHAEGQVSIASGNTSHAEGYGCKATNDNTHAEGHGATASGQASHAEGYWTVAKGKFSHAGGQQTKAGYTAQTVVGKFNKNKSDTLFEVGNGTADSDSKRSNAFEVYTDGHAEVQTMGTTNNTVATKQYVDREIANFDFIKVVGVLPEEGLPNKVYLVPSAVTSEKDLFDEYIWINKGTENNPNYTYEFIASKTVEVDLVNYVTEEKFDVQIENVLNKLIDWGTELPDSTEPNSPQIFLLYTE